ncbi:MAG: hypothetical protein RIK87_16235 [Fuerstiella sp.]
MHRTHLSAIRLLSAALVAGSLSPLNAQAPALDRIECTSFAPNGSAKLTAYGKGFKNILYLWTPVGRIPYQQTGDKPSETEASFEGTLPDKAVPGIYEVRVVADGGISAPHFLVADDLPFFTPTDKCEADPPTTILPVACCLDGHIDPLKPKRFGLSLQQDQQVNIDVFARRLDSRLDPVLRLLTADGRELAFADDTPGLSGDAQLSFTAPTAGTYTLELRDVQYSGGGTHYFHLRVGGFSLIQGSYPRRTSIADNVACVGPDSETIDAAVSPIGTSLSGAAVTNSGLGSGFAMVAVAPGRPALEQEPNNDRESATPVATDLPAVAGRFQTDGDIDWFRLSGRQQQHLCVTAYTRNVGSPADVVLELQDASGKKLQESDDSAGHDAQLSVVLPADGHYFLSVRELSGQGGGSWTYDLDLEWAGRTEVTTTVDTVAVPAGGTATIPVSVNRLGSSNPVELTVEGLPDGIVSVPVVVSDKQKTAFVALQSTAAAPTAFHHQLHVSARHLHSDRKTPVLFSPPAPAKNAPVYELPRLRTGIFAHAAAAAEYSLLPDVALVTVEPGGEAKITITATRTGDWNQPITLSSAVPAAELPTGITISAPEMPKTTAEVVLKADGKAVPGRYSISLQGTLKKDKTTIVRPVPTITLEIRTADEKKATEKKATDE